MSDFSPARDGKFSFGLWTVGWQGVDVFGGAVRPPLTPQDARGHPLPRRGATEGGGVVRALTDLPPIGQPFSTPARPSAAA